VAPRDVSAAASQAIVKDSLFMVPFSAVDLLRSMALAHGTSPAWTFDVPFREPDPPFRRLFRWVSNFQRFR
jgi:hypothetical protein